MSKLVNTWVAPWKVVFAAERRRVDENVLGRHTTAHVARVSPHITK